MKATNVFFGIGIAAALFFLVLAGINAFYPSPNYDDYCPNGFREPVKVNESDNILPCDYQDYDLAQEEYNKNTFLIKSIIAIIIIVLSVYFMHMPFIGNGFLVAGILTLIAGFMDSFSVRTGIDILRFIIGLIATALLIYLGIRWNKKK